MPGLQVSPGMADLEVCHGAYSKGTEGVQTALQRARWKYDHAPLQRAGTLDRNRYSGPVSPLDASVDGPLLDDAPPSSPSSRAEDDDPASPPSPLVSSEQEESGLPPTPPTHPAGDGVTENEEADLSPPALFADSVRNALRTEKSTTPVKQQASPPTPDPSPPRRADNSRTLLANEQKARDLFLHPLAGNALDQAGRTQSPSSHADSFKTAQEQQSFASNASISPVHLPEGDTLPQHWLDTTRHLQSARIGLGAFTVEESPKIEDEGRDGTPTQASSLRVNSDEHVTRASKEENVIPDLGRSPPNLPIDSEKSVSLPGRMKKQPNGLGLSGLQPQRASSLRTQEFNNQVYRRIQEENVKRHSTVSANSGAITVGIVVPALASTPPRTLKRQTKCYSLRGDDSSDSKRNSEASDRGDLTVLKSKKLRRPDHARDLDESPLFESSIRQVSSPAKLGADASDMTALTLASLQESPSAKKVSKFQAQPSHRLRHFSHEDRLSNNMSVRRTSLEASPLLESAGFPTATVSADRKGPRISAAPTRVINNMASKRSHADGARAVTQPLRVPRQQPATQLGSEELSPSSARLRHFSHEARLENNEHVRRTSLDRAYHSPQMESGRRETSFDSVPRTSSPRRSIDARYLHPTTTPGSVMSDRTENIEIGEANGVRLYPHNNDSLLVVQHASSRPTSKDKTTPQVFESYLQNGSVGVLNPIFAAQVEPPTPTRITGRPANQVDSPLTNPRAAPEPPIFKFIPPTPERELIDGPDTEKPQEAAMQLEGSPPRKRLSLVQRARRYSDIILPGLGSLRRPNERRGVSERDRFLSPLWRPQGFWDEFDSEDEYDDFEPMGTLPRGGDTSQVDESINSRKAFFPRAMSKRLPGFRGSGGFLLGNSLGIDRHGTNNRRHYVSTGTRTLSKRQSEELIKRLSQPGGAPTSSQESVLRVVPVRTFVIPFTGGSRAYWVGSKRFRAKLRARRLMKEEREKEKRRDEIRKSIGYRVYHGH